MGSGMGEATAMLWITKAVRRRGDGMVVTQAVATRRGHVSEATGQLHGDVAMTPNTSVAAQVAAWCQWLGWCVGVGVMREKGGRAGVLARARLGREAKRKEEEKKRKVRPT